MFEHFTFGARAQTPHQPEDVSPSPTDASFPSPVSEPRIASPLSSPIPPSPHHQARINDIVARFSQQSLQSHDHRVLQIQAWQHSPSEDEGMQEARHPDSLPEVPLLFPTRAGTVACRRLQRQVNMKLQSCPGHMRDLDTLVQDMIVSNSQCTLRKSSSRSSMSSPPLSSGAYRVEGLVVDMMEGRDLSPDPDEGYGDGEDLEMMLRRASTPSGIRKHHLIRYRASADCVPSRLKVRSVPRMRKRKAPRIPQETHCV